MSFFTEQAPPFHAIAGLLIVAILAAWHDWFQWRIPNRLLAAGCAAALMLAAFAPGSHGMAHALAGGASILTGCGQKSALYLPDSPESQGRATLPQSLNPWPDTPATSTPSKK